MAAVAFSLSGAEEYSPVEVVKNYYFVLLLLLYCDFALKYLSLHVTVFLQHVEYITTLVW